MARQLANWNNEAGDCAYCGKAGGHRSISGNYRGVLGKVRRAHQLGFTGTKMSMEELGDQIGCCRRTVARAIEFLEEHGALIVVPRKLPCDPTRYGGYTRRYGTHVLRLGPTADRPRQIKDEMLRRMRRRAYRDEPAPGRSAIANAAAIEVANANDIGEASSRVIEMIDEVDRAQADDAERRQVHDQLQRELRAERRAAAQQVMAQIAAAKDGRPAPDIAPGDADDPELARRRRQLARRVEAAVDRQRERSADDLESALDETLALVSAGADGGAASPRLRELAAQAAERRRPDYSDQVDRVIAAASRSPLRAGPPAVRENDKLSHHYSASPTDSHKTPPGSGEGVRDGQDPPAVPAGSVAPDPSPTAAGDPSGDPTAPALRREPSPRAQRDASSEPIAGAIGLTGRRRPGPSARRPTASGPPGQLSDPESEPTRFDAAEGRDAKPPAEPGTTEETDR